MSAPGKACETCPSAIRSGALKRLGLDMDNWDYVVALAGNPNTGKSTVFNQLTGLRQHTGNWPGKTVARAEGGFSHNDRRFKLVDLPGTYSLLSTSTDEEVARDFLLFGRPDVTVVVVDATMLERNLNLALQVLQITDRVVIALNLMDEAKAHEIKIDVRALSRELGLPVVPMSARQGEGIDNLLAAIHEVAAGEGNWAPRRLKLNVPGIEQALSEISQALEAVYPSLNSKQWVALRLLESDERVTKAVESGEILSLIDDEQAETLGENNTPPRPKAPTDASAVLSLVGALRWKLPLNVHDRLVEHVYGEAERIATLCVERAGSSRRRGWTSRLDALLTGRWTAIPVMTFIFAVVLWLTITGANVPSAMLANLLVENWHGVLKGWSASLGVPAWIDGLFIDGMYLTTAWVISVMLPPMAIFFPLFTLLEDFGYLPRVAFNLDRLFQKSGAHGKQALTMSMGYGCNAAGVVAARVIDSPREKLIAILTNNFALCNGRWPTQILLASIFLGALVPPFWAGTVAALSVLVVALLGILLTFLVSWGLSRTILKGETSVFSMELPPYRPPRFWRTLYTSLIDRTFFVLWRAIIFALPAGAAIWLVANIYIGDHTLAVWIIDGLDPVAGMMGLTGVILLAYIIAIPANEIVIPAILMLTVLVTGQTEVGAGAGVIFETGDVSILRPLLQAGGWTTLTAISVMLFSLCHNPCTTTLYTIWKETGNMRWVWWATLIPLVIGFVLCTLLTLIWNF